MVESHSGRSGLILGALSFGCGILGGYFAGHPSPYVVQGGLALFSLVLVPALAAFVLVAPTSWKEALRPWEIVVWGSLLYLGVIAGLAVTGGDAFLWVADSRSLHVPGVSRAVEFLSGRGALSMKSIYGGEQVQLVYLWAALWALPLGLTPVVTALALLVLKVVTWLYVERRVRENFGAEAAQQALCFLIFVPTQIFYGLVFYKEPMVQLLASVAIFESLRFYRAGRNGALLAAFVAISFLALERFYLAPMIFFGVLAAMSRLLGRSSARQRVVMAVGALAAAGVFGFLYMRDFGEIEFFPRLARFRADMMAPSDISREWNADLWYPLAVVKVLFTPFFTFHKFEIFRDLSALLTWGSFASQVVIALGCYGFWLQMRGGGARVEAPLGGRPASEARVGALIMALPLIAFILFFGYLAPYSGRQRDSFFSVIATFAALAVRRLAPWIRGRIRERRAG